MPDSALSIGPRLRALAVYLVVFQHVPVERCRQLIADVTGAVVSDGFIHSCLAKAASLATEVVALICALITAAPVAGFDETTLRSGPIRSYIDTARKHRGTTLTCPGGPADSGIPHDAAISRCRARPPIRMLEAIEVMSRPRLPVSTRPRNAPPPARTSCQLAEATKTATTNTA